MNKEWFVIRQKEAFKKQYDTLNERAGRAGFSPFEILKWVLEDLNAKCNFTCRVQKEEDEKKDH